MFIDCATTLLEVEFKLRNLNDEELTNYIDGLEAIATVPVSDTPIVEPTVT